MDKLREVEQGFSIFEVLLIVIVVGILSFTSWFVWSANQDSNKSLNTSISATNDKNNSKPSSGDSEVKNNPYVAWKTYTLKNEKLSFKYPPNWGIQYSSDGTGIDVAQFESNDGFHFSVGAGTTNETQVPQTPTSCGHDYYGTKKIISSTPVKLADQNDFIIFLSEYSCQDSTQTKIVNAIVVPDSANQYSKLKSKYAKDTIKDGQPSLTINMSYSASGPELTAQNIGSDKEYVNAKLVIESMTY